MRSGQKRHEVIVIGGGIIGSSVAMALAERGVRPLVIDLDLSGRFSSSERNAGGVRATWWQPVNIALCRASILYYETIAQQIGFRQKGYLWLYDVDAFAGALAHLEVQRALGHPIEVLSAADVVRRFPVIDKPDGIAGATFSPADGLLNPNLLKRHYRDRARSLGGCFRDSVFVEAIDVDTDEVRITVKAYPRRLEEHEVARLLAGGTAAPEEGSDRCVAVKTEELRAEVVVIACGPWSGKIIEGLGKEGICRPVRRQICIVHNRATNLAEYGMIVDTSGLYLHNEGQNVLVGFSPPDTPFGFDFRYDGEEFMLTQLWPRLYARMSVFERIREVGGWAGLYELSPDRSAVVGLLMPRIYEAHSFSGRGVMQSYAVGQALADLIVHGGYKRFDASALTRERFAKGELAFESLHI